MELKYVRTGAGEPLLLLHAFGLSKQAWSPVLPLLAPHRDVIAVDLPGHGESPMPPPDIPPNPRGYAVMVGRLLDALGLRKVAVAGNSIGGWTSFELALAGRATSVVALSPAGLWSGRESTTRAFRFLAEQAGAKLAGPLVRRALRTPQGRQAVFGEAMTSARSLPPADAVSLFDSYARTQHMAAHIRARRHQGFVGGRDLDVPVAVAFGTEDRFIPMSARRRDELPEHTTWTELPGCGHVMMWDAPELVTSTILAGG